MSTWKCSSRCGNGNGNSSNHCSPRKCYRVDATAHGRVQGTCNRRPRHAFRNSWKRAQVIHLQFEWSPSIHLSRLRHSVTNTKTDFDILLRHAWNGTCVYCSNGIYNLIKFEWKVWVWGHWEIFMCTAYIRIASVPHSNSIRSYIASLRNNFVSFKFWYFCSHYVRSKWQIKD